MSIHQSTKKEKINGYLNTLSRRDLKQLIDTLPELSNANYDAFFKKNWTLILSLAYLIFPDPVPLLFDDAAVGFMGMLVQVYRIWIHIPKKQREAIAKDAVLALMQKKQDNAAYRKLRAEAKVR